MFNGANLSVDNYNNLLIGWAGKAVRTGRNFNAGNSMYSAIASSAKSTLTNTYGWTITDGGLIDDDAMVLIFDTNLSPGTTIALPLQGAVDVTVSWGDSNIDNFNTAGNKTHTYDTDGIYTVVITGSLTQFGSSSGYDSDKLTRVTNWGNLGLTSLSGAFIFASNLTNVPNNLPSGITNTDYMFNFCSKFNANISNWDVSDVTDMYSMFEEATSFNQDISDWDVSSVTDMSVMFAEATSFNQDISYWNVSSVTDMSGMFWNATSFDQNISAWNISNVTTMNGMFGGVTLSTANYDDMLITWADEIPYYGVQPFVPFDGGNSKYSISAVNARESLVQHRWAITDGGIEIPENAMVLEFNTNLSEGNTITLPLQGSLGIVSVYWGDNSANTYTTAGNYDHTYAYAGEYTVYIAGYLSQFGNGNTGYTNADKLVGVADFGNLGTSSFHGAFKGATNLTQVPSSLPSTVTNTAHMFSGATAFNQDIGDWDVSNVTNMSSMFAEATAFNQNIGSWNVSNVTDMESMFYRATAFNQDIGNWDVSNVTDMESMFYRATAFNQDIGNWDVGKVTSLFCMFCEASAFNQDIGSWNVSKVTDMFYMFKNATTFNQNLGGWDVSKVTDMEGMFDGVTLSISNYDALLIGWAGQTVQYDVVFSGGNSKYSSGDAADARASLIANWWTITDGGMISAPSITTAPLTNVTISSTTTGGNITNDWGMPITARGVVWSTSIEPTIANNQGITSDGVGTGTYSSLITGLVEGTTYYIRAYASNENLTGYGATIAYTPEKKSLSLSGSFTVNDKIYDATIDAIIDANNLVLNGIEDWISDVSIESVTLEFEYTSAMNGNNVNITDVQLTGADADNYEVSLVGAPSSPANITKRELTIDGSFTVADKVYDGLTSGSIVNNNLSLLNTIATDEVFLSNTFIKFDNKDVADNKTANIVAVELAGDARFNYTLSLTGAPSTTANIAPKELTVGGAFTVADKEYDGTNAATILENNLTLITPVTGDDVTLINVVAEFDSKDAGEGITVNITAAELDGVDKGNYTLSLVGAPTTTATISSATSVATFTIDNIKVYPNPFQNTINISNASNAKRVVITNSVGKVVMVVDLNQLSNEVIETNLPSGMYLVTIFANDGSRVVRKMVRD